MTPLRKRMIREMELRHFSPRTVEAYVAAIVGLATFYWRSPEQICPDELRGYLHYLATDRKLAPATCNLQGAAITFLFRKVLGNTAFDLGVRGRPSKKLPEIYSPAELARLFAAAVHSQHRALLMTTYAAGLRLSEVTHLRPPHIHSERMLIRVEGGKGRQDRYTVLSPRLLDELRRYSVEHRPGEWLFPNQERTGPMRRGTAQNIFYAAKRRAQLERGHGLHTLRHCFATHLLEAGVDLHTIQVLMGHKNLTTTSVYLHLTAKHLDRKRDALDLLQTCHPACVPGPINS